MHQPASIHRLLLGLAVLLGVALASPAWAGSRLTLRLHDNDPQAEPPNAVVEITVDGHKLRLDIRPERGETGPETTLIVRTEEGTLAAVDHRTRSYVELDKKGLEALSESLSGVVRQLEARVEALPPEQQEAVRQAMAQSLPGTYAARRTAVKVKGQEETKTLDGYPTRLYEVLRGDLVESRLWVAAWGDLGGGDDIPQTFAALAELYSELADTLERTRSTATALAGTGTLFEALGSLPGFPILTENLVHGEVAEVLTLLSVKPAPTDSRTFAPPPSYSQQTLGAARSSSRP